MHRDGTKMRSAYFDIIGSTVSGKMDRQLGSSHPCYPNMIYPINYGYFEDACAEDIEKQDVYVLDI